MFLIPRDKLAEIERKFFSLAFRGTVKELSQFLDTENNFCINACSSVEMGRLTALHYAVLSGNLEKIKLLIKHGSDVNALDVEGKTPIRMLFKISGTAQASSENIYAIWHYLSRHGAHVPSYDDLDAHEKEVINNNMPVYQVLFFILKDGFAQKMRC